jgi:hypothetical protein
MDGSPVSAIHPLRHALEPADQRGGEKSNRGNTTDPSVEEIKRKARVVGLRGVSTPSLESIERRRLQLWALTVFILLAVSIGVALVSTWRPGGSSIVTPTALRIGVVLLAIGFGVYAIEKELHLHRLARLLTDQRVLTTALTNRLHEMSLLLEAGKAMNSVLGLPVVLETILRSAMDPALLRAGPSCCWQPRTTWWPSSPAGTTSRSGCVFVGDRRTCRRHA